MTWLTEADGGVILTLRIQPRASRNEIAGRLGDVLKVRLQAPPVEGKANKALIEFLAETLDMPRRNITILSGDTSRNKRVRIDGVRPDEVRKALSADQ